MLMHRHTDRYAENREGIKPYINILVTPVLQITIGNSSVPKVCCTQILHDGKGTQEREIYEWNYSQKK